MDIQYIPCKGAETNYEPFILILLLTAYFYVCVALLQVLGFKDFMTNPDPEPMGKPRNLALGAFAVFAAFCALGPSLGIQAHSAFLFGIGDLPAGVTASLPWVTHEEPFNALTIPTWMIHFSSVFEYLFAMSLVWQYSETTGNDKWKGLTWGMLVRGCSFFPQDLPRACAKLFLTPS